MDFSGRVVLITGASSGIGAACVREFAKRNAAVAMVDRQLPSSESAISGESKTARLAYFRADVSRQAEVEQLISEVVAGFGGLDILVSNAGIQRFGTATTTTEEEWDEVLNVNLKSAFLMCKYSIPEMIKRGGGAIVVTGSVQSLTAQRNSVHYVVSKHGLLGLVRSVALDYGKQNIRANCVLPGAIDTPMLRWAASLDSHPDRVLREADRLHIRGTKGQPEEAARAIVFLASDLATFITGVALPVDGGLLVPAGGMYFQEAGTGGTKAE